MKRHMTQKGHRSGFTLIEVLVVLVIMGFLVAMVAPKLSGIVDSAVGTTSDSNQQRLRNLMNVYVNQNHALPGGLVNMVKYHTDAYAAGNAAIPLGDDNDKTSREFLSGEMVERMKPRLHYLTTAEAAELVGMGMKNVLTLARVTDAAELGLTAGDGEIENFDEGFVRMNVATNLPVFMIGVGDSDQNGLIDANEFATGNLVTIDANTVVTEDSNGSQSLYTDAALGNITGAIAASAGFVRFDEGRNIGRMVMGLTNKGPFVQNGLLDESGTSPSQLQRKDQYTWGNYLFVLPRLQATMDLLEDIDGDGQKGAVQLVLLDAETGTEADGARVLGRSPNKGFGKFTAQDVTMVTTASPEGHSWGEVSDAFAVSFKD
jgi:prepilin-type N-terminal cleavage/methylation domain-containing protein